MSEERTFEKCPEEYDNQDSEVVEQNVAIPPNTQAGRIFRKLKREPVTLIWKDIDYCLYIGGDRGKAWERKLSRESVAKGQMKCLLQGISGCAKPGELVAIMGSSGAGKTTLLNILAGRVRMGVNDDLQGTVLVNGMQRGKSWRRTAGYVEQEDLLYGLLTIQETIQYAADFKLPRTLTEGEKRSIVDRVIDLLGLHQVRYSRIGTETKRGISGGEKKRVAIGVELVTFPGLLFLDEPTTGLDSATALSLIETLKNIAQKTAMTIVLTIHQPRASILNLFTRIMFMSRGQIAYNGPLGACLNYLDREFGYRCPEFENPADFIIDLLTIKMDDHEESERRVRELHRRWREIEARRQARHEQLGQSQETRQLGGSQEVIIELDSGSTATMAAVKTNPHTLTWPNNRAQEFTLLLGRNFILLSRNQLALGADLGQTIFLCLLLSFVFFQLGNDFNGVQSRLGLLFFVCVNNIFTTMAPILAIFAVDRAILMRERASATYRVFPSFTAKFLSIIPMAMFTLLIFSIPLYFIVGLTMPFDRLLVFILFLAALKLTAITMGLAIAAFSPTLQVSQIIGPMFMVMFMIFGGYLANSSSITWILRWIQYISLVFYTFQALAQNEFTGNYYGAQNDPNAHIPGSFYLSLYSLDQINMWGCLGCVLGLAAIFLVIGYSGLRHTTKPHITLI